MKSWLSRHGIQIAVCLAFVCCSGFYLNRLTTYWGVKHWPSVPAQVFGEKGTVFAISGTGRYGSPLTRVVDQRSAEFRYRVENEVYFSDTVSPNGGGLPWNPLNKEWQAFYKPGAPQVAVLVPETYEGVGLILVITLTGIFTVVYLWFAIQGGRSENENADESEESV